MTNDPVRLDTDGHARAATDRTAELVSRLDAVERTLTGTDADLSNLEDFAAVEERITDLESAVETLTDRLDEVDAATQAIRGYLGGVRTVNEDVERRANAALAKAESLEAALIDESDDAFAQAVASQPADKQSAESTTATSANNTRVPHSARTTHTDRTNTDRTNTDRTNADRTNTDRTNAAADDDRRGLAARLRDAL
ncbi:hypothetical protein E6P09_06560 [Haloferax mediterranei ATCC 33500]|uniref:DUF7310 domain-containing protein n=1 Tax=Haloferax mediterranei (strain ATCC 33500 / DSM 1411 / JCM 8866 / NBRC 14739 / NCIMB 2177 / R-4) TaxID=523841 RepID=I3R2G7_HALMT|nr:hypothetical protein [Haloferax mediterranei]AFK18427.1 hypothetical protein HFX_0704 [Haloferax mediterranei ATCC 33500]AHZ22183.1 hypothetical protein BM92_05715 [Haloferax mediterranei ATCC 33500]EMA02297.1 hypothetical protein C439_06940 [Haloferax mediterranei ATCC 33500]MDX5988519.1 hypothetical protein [Haloferax mediterranei ATCC 33500]QCQ74935.1 hypothetical protein E6P09_06560 [Haloferax mediterranei ATCC 33500]